MIQRVQPEIPNNYTPKVKQIEMEAVGIGQGVCFDVTEWKWLSFLLKIWKGTAQEEVRHLTVFLYPIYIFGTETSKTFRILCSPRFRP